MRGVPGSSAGLVSLGLLGGFGALSLLAPAAATAQAGFGLGVAAGEITSSAATLWTRADAPGPVALRLSARAPAVRCSGRETSTATRRRTLAADPAGDNTVQSRVTGLRAGRRYFYRFCSGASASRLGRFVTAPARRSRARVDFALTGDADGTIDPATNQPAYNRFEVYGRMALERNDFNINLGDVVYSDSAVAGVPPALSLQDKWAKYRLNLSYPNLQALRATAGLFSHWDDHEFIDDFSVAEHGRPLYDAGAKAFLDYSPVSYTPRAGLYRRFRWGRNLELFFLDERSFRDAKASADPACIDPQTGRPDPLPQLPVRLRRELFGPLLGPSVLTFPTAPQCNARITDPARTLLGGSQLAAFKRAIARSTATFKVVVNELPIQRLYFAPYDRWEGYEAERREVLRHLRSRVDNVVFLTTDLHATLINDVLLTTFPEEGGTVDTGMEEVVTGPVALKSFAVDTDLKSGMPGASRLVAGFFKAPRPAGLGMRCTALSAYSYVHVRVTARSLTIAPRDQDGKPIRDDDGTPCRRVIIRA